MKTLLVGLILLSSPLSAATFDTVCQNYSWACSTSTIKSRVDFSVVKEINKRINHTVKPITDSDQYGVNEFWSLPTSRGGDCEDYALLKKYELIKAGVSPSNLLLSIVMNNRELHAVLLYKIDGAFYVLDNLTDRITRVENSDYRFIFYQNPENPSKWIAFSSVQPQNDGVE